MSSLMFYSKPVPLDKKKHLNFKLERQDNYAFAKTANSLPVAGFEFFEASRHYPIFFVKNPKEEFIPIAMLSLKKEGHDLGDHWEGVYVPAYVRRYPFVLSSEGTVLFDEDAPHLQTEKGDALFLEDGELTDTTKEVVKFLEMADRGYQLTQGFSKALAEKELLEPFKGQIKLQSGSINLSDLYAINEKKLHEVLSESEVNDWFKKGWLAWSHAHLHSIGSMNEIFKRARKAHETSKEALEASETA